MNNNYLIPANAKKSQLILGFFTLTDLIIVIVGAVWTFIMLLFITTNSLLILVLKLLPLLIAAFLVMPVPNYHNILQLLTNILNFYRGNRKYYWRGWCIYEKFNDSNK